MSRQRTTRLRESNNTAPKGETVIDADFAVIGRRGLWRRLKLALLAVFWTALLGFAVPQIWIFSQRIGEFLARN